MKNKYMGNRWPNEEQKMLLQACLFSGSRALDAWENWKRRINFDELDFASFKLISLVSRNPDFDALKDPIFAKCKGIYRRVWVENHLTWEKILPTLEQLLKSGVDQIVILKGMAMILHYYRDFGVRVIGDVDILIKRSHLLIAASVLKTCGWEPKFSYVDIENPAHLARFHALNFIHPEGMNLDLHWSFIEENAPILDEAVLRDAGVLDIKNISLYVPNPTDLLLQTCVHGVKHSPIPLIRWVADAVTILRHSEKEIDWDRLIELANQTHLCTLLSSALDYLVEEFDAPIPEIVIQKLKKASSVRLERLEYRCNAYGYHNIAAWARYCLNKGLMTRKSQILNITQYLQFRARLKAPWQIPFYLVYWIFKRTCRVFTAVKS